MVIYKNPYVSRESYFVRTGVARTGKAEASASTGWVVEFVDGKWQARKGAYYNRTLKYDFPVVAENAVSLETEIESAVINAVIDCFVEQELYSMDGKESGE